MIHIPHLCLQNIVVGNNEGDDKVSIHFKYDVHAKIAIRNMNTTLKHIPVNGSFKLANEEKTI